MYVNYFSIKLEKIKAVIKKKKIPEHGESKYFIINI